MAALFQSLLFEACGRTVNPVNGAVGLLSSGNWHLCQAAVDTVLRGGVLRPFPPELLAHALSTPPRAAIPTQIPFLINGAQAVNPASMMRFWASDHAANLQQTTSLGSCGMSGMTTSSLDNSSFEENDRDAPAGGGQKRKLLNLFV